MRHLQPLDRRPWVLLGPAKVGPVLDLTRIKLKKGLTVFDDEEADSRSGNADLDFFMLDELLDRSTDKNSTETRN